MQSWLPFRWLFLVCLVAFAIGIRESRRPRIDVYGDEQRNYPDAMSRLYPGIAQVDYLAGRKAETVAARGLNLNEIALRPELLEKYVTELQPQLEEARLHYERALAAGLRSDENLHYNYALTLMRLRAESSQIEQSIAAWRRDFPHSKLRDLNDRWLAIREEQRNLDRFLANFHEQQVDELRRRQYEQLHQSLRQPKGDAPAGPSNP